MANKLIGDLVTFSRGTGATRVNSAGLIVGVDFSATSNTITTGSKTFTLAADANVNRDWAVNSSVIAVSQAGATGSMTGTVTSYTPSTQALVINVTSVTGSGTSTDWRIGSLEMREDYDPVTLVRKGVLSEVSATNLLTFSEAFENAAWLKTNLTTTANTTLSPSGSIDADSIVEGAGTINPILQQASTGAVSGDVYTFSVFLKQLGTREYGMINFEGTAASGVPGISVKFSDGSVILNGTGAVPAFQVIKLNNGFYFLSISFTMATGNFSPSIRPSQTGLYANRSYTGDGVSGLIVYGAQLSLSSSATSYIPTTTTQVTRNADNFPLTAAALTSIRQGEGTLYAEIDCPDTGVAQKRALRLSGTNADIRIGKQGTGTLSNFTKMVEGAGLRLMGTATSLIRGNGQELLPVTAINDRNGVAVAFPVANGVAFDGSNRFGLLSAGEEVYIDGLLGTFSGKGAAAISINGAHYNGNRFLMASNNAGVVLVSDGTSYRRINTPVITQPTNEITSGLVGATLRNVIVGNGGFIATSDDNGETWTARTSGTTQSLNGASFGSVGGTNYFIVAGNTGQLRYSTDGITYTNATGQSGSGNYGDVHIANNIVVAVANGGAVFVSTNGTTFTAATATNTPNTLVGVTYSPTLNLWIAVGVTGTIITATDPAGTWTVQTSGTTQNLQEVGIFNNAIYVVGSTQTLLTSTNGTSYTSLTAGVTANLAGIAASPTTLLITGATGAMASSTDGTTFTSRTNNNATLNGIAFGNNVFVSVGNSANGSGYIATIGADGTVTRRVSGVNSALSTPRFLNGAFYVGSFVNLGGRLLKSTDSGQTWQTLVLGGVAEGTSDIAFGNNIYIAVQGTGRVVTSTDGTAFSQVSTGVTSQTLRAIDFANGTFVLVGDAGAIVTTTNGTTWTLRTSGTTANLNSVMFSTRDNLWYAAGNGGVLLYAADPTGTWTAVQNSGTASILGTTLQSNQPLVQFKSGVNKIALSYKANQVIAALNGVASTSDTAATIPTITAASIAENLNGYIGKVEIFPTALTTAELTAKTL